MSPGLVSVTHTHVDVTLMTEAVCPRGSLEKEWVGCQAGPCGEAPGQWGGRRGEGEHGPEPFGGFHGTKWTRQSELRTGQCEEFQQSWVLRVILSYVVPGPRVV